MAQVLVLRMIWYYLVLIEKVTSVVQRYLRFSNGQTKLFHTIYQLSQVRRISVLIHFFPKWIRYERSWNDYQCHGYTDVWYGYTNCRFSIAIYLRLFPSTSTYRPDFSYYSIWKWMSYRCKTTNFNFVQLMNPLGWLLVK